MSCVLVSGQFFGSYDNAYRFGYDSSDFGGIGSFGQVSGGAASIRDPRQNRGKKKSLLFITEYSVSNRKQNAKKKTSVIEI